MYPSFEQTYFVNVTDVSYKLRNNSQTVGISPRWLFFSKVSKSDYHNRNNSAITVIIDSKKEAEYGLGRSWNLPSLSNDSCYVSDPLLRYLNVNPRNNESVTLSLDPISIGYTLSGYSGPEIDFFYNTLIQFREMILKEIFKNNTAIPNFLKSIDKFIDEETKQSTFYTIKSMLTFRKKFTVSDIVPSSSGKVPTSLGNVVFIEKDYVNRLANDFLKSILDINKEKLKEWFPDIDFDNPIVDIILDFIRSYLPRNISIELENYALMGVAAYKDRLKAYSKDSIGMKKDIIYWTNSMMEDIGLDYPVVFKTPLIDTLSVSYYLRLILEQLLLIIQIFLLCLGCYLIYALLISDVESKVYESGMLRALGMKNYTLIMVIIIQSLIYSIPGVIFGLLLSSLINIPVSSILSGFTALKISPLLSGPSIGMGIAVGLIVPLFAVIIPIKRALSKSLRDALDLYHSVMNETKVVLTRLENLGLSSTQLYIGVLLVAFGFVIYYVIPLSFIFMKLALFFNVFVLIIVGLLAGLCMIAIIFQHRLQYLMLNLIMWRSDRRKLKTIVRKNLHGHIRRNRNTSFLLNISIAFIIFSGSIFRLQSHTIISNVKVIFGADISLLSTDSNPELALDEKRLSAYLDEKQNENDSCIASYSYATFSINDLAFMGQTIMGNLPRFRPIRTLIYAVDDNYLDTVYDEYVNYKELASNIQFKKTRSGRYDVIRALSNYNHTKFHFRPTLVGTGKNDEDYDFENSTAELYDKRIPILISEATRRPMSLDTSTLLSLNIESIIYKKSTVSRRSSFYRMGTPLASISKLPGFFFSSYEQTVGVAPSLISMKDYYELMKISHNMSYMRDEPLPSTPPKRALYVRLKENTSHEQKEIIINGLRNFITSDRLFVTDMKEIETTTRDSIKLLDIFLNIISSVVMVLCFFVVFISFTSNVTENEWELGVLRSIGLTGNQVIRLYIYEAVSIILTSVLLGSFIGIFVSVTFTLQISAFTELPMIMSFPTLLFFVVLIMSMTVAILGSYFPARGLIKKKIANTLKGI